MTDVDEADLIRVVLADANVLYSRVLRDYLLYAADEEIIAVAWSAEILAEVTEHLVEKVAGFDVVAGERLVRAMNRAFPVAEVEPGEEHWRMLADVTLPDEDGRHVLAALVAAEAIVLCISTTRDFRATSFGLWAPRCSLQTSCCRGSWPSTSCRCSTPTARPSRHSAEQALPPPRVSWRSYSGSNEPDGRACRRPAPSRPSARSAACPYAGSSKIRHGLGER